MINVGVIGLGMMGSTHLDVYGKRDDVRVVAIADRDADRLHGRKKAAGNIEGQAQGGIDLSSVTKYEEGMDLIHDDQVHAVDICLPTPMHREYAEAAFAAGKHVMIEKPLARTAADALAIAQGAEKSSKVTMIGMCMRFWPAWVWLKQAVDQQTFGKVLAAHFRRVAQHPGGPFYSDGAKSGGAILDLHVHDTDFVHFCFGKPASVFSRGYSKITGEPDHVLTHYLYEGGPMVSAEGGWAMADGFGFQMQYTVNFERATAIFDIGSEPQLQLVENGESAKPVEVPEGMGYDHELAYFIECIQHDRKPETVTARQAAETVQIVEAEKASIQSGRIEKVQY